MFLAGGGAATATGGSQYAAHAATHQIAAGNTRLAVRNRFPVAGIDADYQTARGERQPECPERKAKGAIAISCNRTKASEYRSQNSALIPKTLHQNLPSNIVPSTKRTHTTL
jgi:hypothetical protein